MSEYMLLHQDYCKYLWLKKKLKTLPQDEQEVVVPELIILMITLNHYKLQLMTKIKIIAILKIYI